MTQTPTPIDYSDLPVGRLGPRASGGTASLVVTPAAENGGEIGLHIFEEGGGNSWPARVHHGRAIMVGELAGTDGAAVEEILRAHEDLLRAIDSAYLGTRWDGSNHVGVWKPGDIEGETADDAPAEQLREALAEAASYWDAENWLSADLSDVARKLYAELAEGKSTLAYAAAEVATARDQDALIDLEDVDRLLESLLDDAATAERYGIDIAKVCADRFAALRAAGKSEAEAAEGAREALDVDRRSAGGVVRDGRFVLSCECGTADGDRHDYDLDASEDVVILEWMPPQYREAHSAAGNSGVYPHNGAIRLVTLRECAETIVADEGDERWARIVAPADATRYRYTVFNADPMSSGGSAWPDRSDVELEADDAAEAAALVEASLAAAASGLSGADGYEVGDTLHALVWDEDGTVVASPKYVLTEDDLA